MKISPLLPIIIVSLLMASCTWGPKKPSTTEPIIPPAVTAPDASQTPEVVEEETKNPETTTPDTDIPPATSPDTNAAPPPSGENPEVSTEELTKELDAFVDEITKGL